MFRKLLYKIFHHKEKENCGNCIYFIDEYEHKNIGRSNAECRKNAPIGYEEVSKKRIFPIVKNYSWCGDWKELKDE